MSAVSDLADIVRNCDTGFLDAHYDHDATADAIADQLHAAVLAEADLLPKAHVVAWLVKKAREETPVWLLASKVERGAIRPDNLLMLPPDFFEVGRTYSEPGDTTDWRFRCDAITTHPETGERTALGWKHFHGQWSECSYPESEWEIHQIADALATTARPLPAVGVTDTNRRARLLHEMALGARWKSGDVVAWYQTQGLTRLGTRAARHDLAVLRDSGAITQHDEKGVRFYTRATHNTNTGNPA